MFFHQCPPYVHLTSEPLQAFSGTFVSDLVKRKTTMIATKIKHQKITAEDLVKGRVICYKCLAMAALGVMTIGLGIKFFTPASIVFNHVGLISWLTLVMGSTLYFVCANRPSKKTDTKMVLKNDTLVIYENGRRKAAENIRTIQASFVSCQCKDSGFKPAVVLRGSKIGKLSVCTHQDQFDWLHFKTLVKRTDYVVDNDKSWNELLDAFNQSRKVAA